MAIVFSAHAQYQIKERNIATSAVLRVMRRPEATIQQSEQRYRAIGNITKNGKQYLLIVIYDIQGTDKKEVVTAFLTSKIKKYLL